MQLREENNALLAEIQGLPGDLGPAGDRSCPGEGVGEVTDDPEACVECAVAELMSSGPAVPFPLVVLNLVVLDDRAAQRLGDRVKISKADRAGSPLHCVVR